MAEGLQIIILILFSWGTLAALLVLLPALLPNRVARAQQVAQNSPGRSFVIGLVNFLFFGLVATIFAQGGEAGGLIALIILMVIMAMTAVGLAAINQIVQARLYPKGAGVRVGLKTAVILLAGGLVPLLGWLVVAPVLLLISLGAGIIAQVRPRQKPQPTEFGTIQE
ncbi:hypothetical protein [Candidatus Leptofilum sp.]|uniref:hypothetical protein n=1 Tax=Candidatus Leptofilum sp. TaxID=3241576 RepID=UPI003B59D7D9